MKILKKIALYSVLITVDVWVGYILWQEYRYLHQDEWGEGTEFRLVKSPAAGFTPNLATEFEAGAESTAMQDDELVLGVVSSGGSSETVAKAYPIRYLSAGEHVNDELAGMPLCASW